MDTEDKNATSNFAAQLAKIKSNMVTTTSSKVSSQNNQQKNNLTVNIIVNWVFIFNLNTQINSFLFIINYN